MAAEEARGIKDAEKICWQLIDLAKSMVNNKALNDKVRGTWARILSQALRTLVDVLTQEEGRDIGKDLASILDSLPAKYKKELNL